MSRFVREDMSGVQIPQTVPLTLETSISHRDVPSDAIYPKVSSSAYFVSA